MGNRRVEHLLNAVHVRSETGHDHPLPAAAHHPVKCRTDVSLRCREAGNFSVGGIDHEQVDTLFTESGESAQVRNPAIQRQLIELEVTRMQDEASWGTQGDRQGIRDRMVNRDELAFELTDADPVTVGDHALRDLPQVVFP